MRQKTVSTKLLESVTEVCYKVRQVFQSVTEVYYKVRQVLQSVTEVYYKVCQVLQSVADCYYKVRQVLQRATATTKWDVTPVFLAYFLLPYFRFLSKYFSFIFWSKWVSFS